MDDSSNICQCWIQTGEVEDGKEKQRRISKLWIEFGVDNSCSLLRNIIGQKCGAAGNSCTRGPKLEWRPHIQGGRRAETFLFNETPAVLTEGASSTTSFLPINHLDSYNDNTATCGLSLTVCFHLQAPTSRRSYNTLRAREGPEHAESSFNKDNDCASRARRFQLLATSSPTAECFQATR